MASFLGTVGVFFWLESGLLVGFTVEGFTGGLAFSGVLKVELVGFLGASLELVVGAGGFFVRLEVLATGLAVGFNVELAGVLALDCVCCRGFATATFGFATIGFVCANRVISW